MVKDDPGARTLRAKAEQSAIGNESRLQGHKAEMGRQREAALGAGGRLERAGLQVGEVHHHEGNRTQGDKPAIGELAAPRRRLKRVDGTPYSATTANAGTIGTISWTSAATTVWITNVVAENHASRSGTGGTGCRRRRIARKPRPATAMSARLGKP